MRGQSNELPCQPGRDHEAVGTAREPSLSDDLYFTDRLAWSRKYPDVAAGMGATNEYGSERP